jgi:hypothetical protein
MLDSLIILELFMLDSFIMLEPFMLDPFIMLELFMLDSFIMLELFIMLDSFIMLEPCALATTAVTDNKKLTTIKSIIVLLLWLNVVPIWKTLLSII